MRVVVALGGNALLRRGQPLTEELQEENVAVAAEAISSIARQHETIVTHGNGPQVGLLALEADAYAKVPPYGLDVLGAETQGMIGLLLEQALRNRLRKSVATILTSVIVSDDDPALVRPSKPIGPIYSEGEARRLSEARGWTIAGDGAGFRRVVPSPQPREVLEIDAIRVLLSAGILVVCGGGGGVPVRRDPTGNLRRVEAVVDKDLTSALLAIDLNADRLLLLTDVPGVAEGWGTPGSRYIREATVGELRKQEFAAGSMGPKVEAACRFAERTGYPSVIGAMADAPAMLAGEKGTIVRM